MEPTTPPTPPPGSPSGAGDSPTPWHKSELFRWAASIAVGFVLNWLASRGITPAPLPAAPTPGVLVLNVSPSPATAPISTVTATK